MNPAGGPWLQVRDLSLSRGQRQILDRIAFDLDRGCALLLQGPNGSGKSTLLRALLGLAIASGGELCLAGERFSPGSRRLCRAALYQGHAGGLKGELDVLENLSLAAALDGSAANPDELRAALTATGIAREAGVMVRRLSQGQKQRLVLARLALSNLLPAIRRPLWLLDEPSAALDRAGAAMLDGLLATHLQRGGAAIVATHLPLLDDPGSSSRTRSLNLA